MNQIYQDVLSSVRQLRRAPAFLFTAVLTLALGIGGTTAIFTLVHAVLFKSLPVTRPNELYRIGDKIHCCNWGGYTQSDEFSLFSDELYRHFRDNTPAFTDLAAFQGGSTNLGVRRTGAPHVAETSNGQFVSGNFFRTFGVSAWIGRALDPRDDRGGAQPVAVMSYHAWQQRYGGDPEVVGSVFQINDKPFTVVGIAPPAFFGATLRSAVPDFWMPLSQEPLLDEKTERLTHANEHWLEIIGRVRPGTNPKALEAQLRLELRQWQDSHLADMKPEERSELAGQTLHLTPGGAGVTAMREQYKDSLRLLLGAAGCVLLIASANLANLLLVRGLRSRLQTSLRVALGASRARLVRRSLVESFLLSLLGGAAGLVVAYAGTSLILRLAFAGPAYVPIAASPSWPVLLFAFALSLLTGIGFGVTPAWMTSHTDPIEALRGANRSVGGGAQWPQKALVIGQVAVSMILISAAIMLGQSLERLKHQNFGFAVKDRYLVYMNPMVANYPTEKLQFLYEQVEQRLQRVPGIEKVAAATYAPLSGDNWNAGVFVQGATKSGADIGSQWTRITPNFFTALGNSILQGRALDEHDTATSPEVAVVNEAFARKFFKGENPVGQRFGQDEANHSSDYEIVGVAKDMRYSSDDPTGPAPAIFFLPETQSVAMAASDDIDVQVGSHYLYNLIIWAPGGPVGLEAEVRRAVAEIDPNLTMDFSPYPDVVRLTFGQQNLMSKLTLLFSALALLLAAVGLYGVTAYSVEQRTNEIGVRMALGANRRQVLSMMLRGALVQVIAGMIIGVPGAIGVGRALTSQLYSVKAYDVTSLLIAMSVLVLSALAATIIPAERAAAIDPMRALRTE